MRKSFAFRFVVLLISISFIFGNVDGEKKREYTVAFKGSDDVVEVIINDPEEKQPQLPKHAPPKNVRIHPIYEAREFLGEHNKIRKELGEPLLKWDRSLAHYARRFAGKRAVNCDMIHSRGPYGENIYWGADYSKHTAGVAVRAWASETNNYNPMKNTCNQPKMCGHYKQIVWKTSTKLGCARAKCNNGGVYIICSYDPPGNYFGESPFDTPESSQTPSTPTTPTAQTTPTPPGAQTKPTSPPGAQTKQTKPTSPPGAQTKPTSPTGAQRKQTKPTSPPGAQTKQSKPTSPPGAQTKPSSPPGAQTKQTKPTSPSTPS